jgi:hypothetical protein
MLQMNDQIAAPKASKTPSALAKFLEGNKGKKTNETDKKAVGAKFKKLMGEREKLVSALAKFDAEAQKTSEEMIACYGSTEIVIDGVRFVPTSRGERIFYKKMSDDKETVEL